MRSIGRLMDMTADICDASGLRRSQVTLSQRGAQRGVMVEHARWERATMWREYDAGNIAHWVR